MANKIPEYFAREQMETSQLPRAPAWYLAKSGQGLEAEAMAGSGRALQEVSSVLSQIQRHFLGVEGNSQYDTARRQGRERFNQLTLELEDSRDPSTYDKSYKKALKDIKAFMPKNRLGAQKYQSWLDLRKPEWDMSIEQTRRRMVKLNAQEALYTNVQGAIKSGNREEINTLYRGAADDKVITPKQASQGIDNAYHDIDWYAGVHLANENPVWLMRIIDSKDAFKNLNTVEKQRLKTIAESEIDHQRIVNNRERVELANQMRKDATDLMVKDELTFGWLQFNKDNIADDDYERFNKYLLARKAQTEEEALKAEKEQNKEKVLQQRWELISEISEMIDAIKIEGKGDPVAIKEKLDELAKLGSTGVTDAEQYRAKLSSALQIQQDPENPLKRTSVVRGFKLLEELKDMEISLTKAARKKAGKEYLFSEAQEDLTRWLGIKNDFEVWILENKDATDTEIEAKLNSMTKPIREEVSKGFLSRLWEWNVRWRPYEIYKRWKGIEGEPATREEFENKVRTLEDENEAKAYYLKWKHKWQ